MWKEEHGEGDYERLSALIGSGGWAPQLEEEEGGGRLLISQTRKLLLRIFHGFCFNFWARCLNQTAVEEQWSFRAQDQDPEKVLRGANGSCERCWTKCSNLWRP